MSIASKNSLTLAVAGSRKTQGIVDECSTAERDARILILTYTTINQSEVRSRIRQDAGDHPNIEVMGWFSFLIHHFARPFTPYMFPNTRVRGFDNDSPYQVKVPVTAKRRYFSTDGRLRKAHLAHLATLINASAGGHPLHRLERLYDRIYIDEVQDLGGYDLEVLSLLFHSSIEIRMVGDVRQATLATTPQERKNKKYLRMGIWEWFKKQESKQVLSILQRSQSYRCRPEITAFADSLFDSSWGFEPTESCNLNTTEHDGLFLLRTIDVPSYAQRFDPLGLRVRRNVATSVPLDFMNFGEVKGVTRSRVVIVPTKSIKDLLQEGKPLEDQQAASLYVAVTRAEQSVAFVLDSPGKCPYPYWTPA